MATQVNPARQVVATFDISLNKPERGIKNDSVFRVIYYAGGSGAPYTPASSGGSLFGPTTPTNSLQTIHHYHPPLSDTVKWTARQIELYLKSEHSEIGSGSKEAIVTNFASRIDAIERCAAALRCGALSFYSKASEEKWINAELKTDEQHLAHLCKTYNKLLVKWC